MKYSHLPHESGHCWRPSGHIFLLRCCAFEMRVLGIVILLLFGLASVTQAHVPVDKRLEKEQSELDRVKKEMAEKRSRGLQLKKREAAANRVLTDIEKRLWVKKEAEGRIQAQVLDKDLKIKEALDAMHALMDRMTAGRAAAARQIRLLYREQRLHFLRIPIHTPEEPSASWRLYALKSVARLEADRLGRLQIRKTALKDQGVHLSQSKAELLAHQEMLHRETLAIQKSKEDKDRSLAQLVKQRVAEEQSLEELRRASLRLETLIQKLEAEKEKEEKELAEGEKRKRKQGERKKEKEKRKEEEKGQAPGQFAKQKGKLQWPGVGEVVRRFGRQKHPEFDDTIFSRGIELHPFGAEVSAVYGGKVVHADDLRGVGKVVIVSHGEDYYTIYAHLKALFVAVGDRVKQGKSVGDVSLTEKGRLYFEIRHRRKSLDPLAWLIKR